VAFFFYQVVVASVLLFGSETWVLPPSAYKALERFHVEAARHLTGMVPREEKGEWVYPHSADVLAAAHLQTIEYYIQKRRHTIAQTIGNRKILEEAGGRRGAEAPNHASIGGDNLLICRRCGPTTMARREEEKQVPPRRSRADPCRRRPRRRNVAAGQRPTCPTTSLIQRGRRRNCTQGTGACCAGRRRRRPGRRQFWRRRGMQHSPPCPRGGGLPLSLPLPLPRARRHLGCGWFWMRRIGDWEQRRWCARGPDRGRPPLPRRMRKPAHVNIVD
jgi:hypothetical protein